MSDNIITIKHLKKHYQALPVLLDINLEVNRGDVISIIGASGSGKSTFLRCLNLLEIPDHGEILYCNKNILKEELNLNKYRSDVGMIFQSFNLFNNLTVLENCVIGQMKVLNRNREEAEEKALLYLQKVGMAEFAKKSSTQLSGGQKQRVAIARALCMEPQVLLFDEPTSALDPQMVGDILKIIKHLALKGMTMIIVTHEMQFARDVSNEVIFMHNGIIEEAGTPEQIFEHPRSMGMIQFLSRQY